MLCFRYVFVNTLHKDGGGDGDDDDNTKVANLYSSVRESNQDTENERHTI
jgi:hypothetical protein